MSWSLSEIEGLARKATKGAGLPWGIAEEAGKAARWLCAAGLPGAEALAALLQRNDGMAYAALCPVDGTVTGWQAKDGPLCPLIAGATICDQAHGEIDITLAHVSHPVLLIPYMVMAADMSHGALCLSWDGAHITRGPDGTFLKARPGALQAADAINLRIAPADDVIGKRVKRAYRGDIPPEIAAILQDFAHRTYAPDTAESRLSGAGAGLSDND